QSAFADWRSRLSSQHLCRALLTKLVIRKSRAQMSAAFSAWRRHCLRHSTLAKLLAGRQRDQLRRSWARVVAAVQEQRLVTHARRLRLTAGASMAMQCHRRATKRLLRWGWGALARRSRQKRRARALAAAVGRATHHI
ncbi:unnamed protein product, partial [Chrysoparadoxa australica]